MIIQEIRNLQRRRPIVIMHKFQTFLTDTLLNISRLIMYFTTLLRETLAGYSGSNRHLE
jgi:hypothetical protein